jgi:hypothetical protein
LKPQLEIIGAATPGVKALHYLPLAQQTMARHLTPG